MLNCAERPRVSAYALSNTLLQNRVSFHWSFCAPIERFVSEYAFWIESGSCSRLNTTCDCQRTLPATNARQSPPSDSGRLYCPFSARFHFGVLNSGLPERSC